MCDRRDRLRVSHSFNRHSGSRVVVVRVVMPTGEMSTSEQNDHYTYRVTWSENDEEYVGLCAEFPSLSWLSRSPGHAP